MTKRSSSPAAGHGGGQGAGARLRSLAESWERSLRARNVAAKTLTGYTSNLRYVLDYWDAREGGPVRVGDVTRVDCEAYLAACLERGLKPSTVLIYHEALNVFFRWCVDEAEIALSPMARIRAPIVPDDAAPPPVLSPEDVRRLLRACGGATFRDRRDHALLRLMLDTGMRHKEVINIRLEDVDLNEQLVTVTRKGRKVQRLPFGVKTAAALDRYLRARDAHPRSESALLWVARDGPLSYAGLYDIIKKRAEQAGLPHIWPHVLRHTFSSAWLEMGGQEGDLIELNGWSPTGARPMLYRYGRGARQRRARDAHKRLAPGDQY